MIYHVTVKPGSKKGPLILEDGDNLTVFLRERPVEGAANDALIKLLSKHFKIAKSCIAIKAGGHSRKKLVEILEV